VSGRYKASDLARLGEAARRQIELAQYAFRERDKLREQARANTNKFGAVRTTLDGQTFASKLEAERYAELKLLQRAGRITELISQPEFPITVNGYVVCKYIADFEYTDANGKRIIEDCKSKPTMTPLYRLKKRLMLAVLGLTVTEFPG
jgi:hypothetical protein